MKFLLPFLLLLLFTITIISCGDDDPAAAALTSSDFSIDLSSELAKVLPVTGTSSFAPRASDSDWGQPYLEIYHLLRSASDNLADNKTMLNNVDRVNGYLSAYATTCDTAVSSTTLPYDFEGTAATYTCGTQEDFDGRLLSLVWNQESPISVYSSYYSAASGTDDGVDSSAMKASYNTTTGAIRVEMASYVSYKAVDAPSYTGSNLGEFIMKMEVIGNTTDNSFTVRTIDRNPGAAAPEVGSTGVGSSDGYELDMVGKGVATDGHFLLRFTDNDTNSTPTYYCIATTALGTLAEFETAVAGNGETVLGNVSSDCSAYTSDVSGMADLDDTVGSATGNLPSQYEDVYGTIY